MLASYLARMGAALAVAPLRRNCAPLDEVHLPMTVWPTDIDPYLHLNNGRYLTLMDIGRFDHGLRTGLAKVSLRKRWLPVAGAATVKFRRELRALTRFRMGTRIAWWDDRWLYVEHRLMRGETLHTWGAVKLMVRQGKTRIPPATYLAAVGVTARPPAPEGELALWISTQGQSH